MMMLYFPLGTEAYITLECGHSYSREVCGEFCQYTNLWCDRCVMYSRLQTIVATRLGPEQGKDDIPHHLPEIA